MAAAAASPRPSAGSGGISAALHGGGGGGGNAALYANDPASRHPVFFTTRQWRPVHSGAVPSAQQQHSPVAQGFIFQDSLRQGGGPMSPRL
ncbi:uncharacterized protein PgNI_03813 [Pyricularia grisea]|uniref:Uncharacterized protein n=1 Tax=Pyricularia grisea TaxID=148305 RepID=A0A6P8BEH1_PYRGI|nr:uncharacterized protein PgNI_03813 [Pyricularia grisea]TLD14097.1 hypothetical protein PgNI_03813 [Pyricularia grisea]